MNLFWGWLVNESANHWDTFYIVPLPFSKRTELNNLFTFSTFSPLLADTPIQKSIFLLITSISNNAVY